MITILAFTLLATAFVLWRLPVGTCAECTHCRIERLAKEREVEAQAANFYGIPLCRSCGRYHPPEEAHRR
jgi:hypothetical protein